MSKTVMIHGVPPWAPSGYGVQGRLLAQGLQAQGHNVVYSAYGGFLREEKWDGIPILACGGTSKGVGRIAYNYQRAQADLMIIVADFWVFAPQEFDGLTVVPWVPVDTHPLGLLDRLALNSVPVSCNLHPVAMTQHGKAMLEDAGFPVAAVIPHAVDRDYFPGDRKAWRREHGIDDDVFLVSQVGVNGDFPDRKGYDVLLAAFQIFAQEHDDARLYLHCTMGNIGTEGIDLMQVIQSLGLGGKVGFAPQLKRMSDELGPDYMAGMYRASDVLASPSRGEGFGVPIIEAMACGTPVIGSKCSSMPELIEPGRTGWLCDVQPQWCKHHGAWWHTPLVSSLVSCLESAYSQAHRMRNAAASEGRKYSPEKMIRLWTELLDRI